MSADWNQIKTEYITTKTSFRKLAEKYGLHKDTIWKKAKDEDWEDLRRQHTDKVQTEILKADTRQKVSRAERLQSVADKLLGKVEAVIESGEFTVMDTQGMKHLSGVLKDIKDIHMIKSEADIREQEARIEKLRKDAQKEDKNSTVTVVLEGALKDYAQ